MIEAGINPVLAASAGLSAANVGSGASASIGVPSAFMGQTFADQVSGYSSNGGSFSYGEGESSGSSWQNSASGLAVGLEMLGKTFEDIINIQNTGEVINTIVNGAEEVGGHAAQASMGILGINTGNNLIEAAQKAAAGILNYLPGFNRNK